VLLGVAALACGACGGAFVGNADLDALVREHLPRETPPYTPAVAARLPMAPSVRYLRCPACDQAMNRRALFRTSGVVVDVCTAHGTWLDEGELAAALSFVASGGLDDGRPRAR
jgi:Zn-finger nucleic acid-binding protein